MPDGNNEQNIIVNGEVVKFKYPVIVYGNFIYSGTVDNKNELMHDGGTKSQIGLVSLWLTN